MPTLSQPLSSPRCSPSRGASTFAQHRGYLCLATAMLAMLVLLAIAGCQTPGAPSTVAPPATGMIGQPAQYGSWATPPQGAAYPPTASAPPMPGPATQWQGAAPPTMTQPAGAMPPQQFANQMPANTNQFTQGVNAQPQQLTPQQQQLTNQAQAAVNQYQQNAANQWQQMNNQLQGQTQQAFNNVQQQGQQYINQGQQAVTAQMPPQQPAPNTSWNPFSTSAMSQPPARATPQTTVPRY